MVGCKATPIAEPIPIEEISVITEYVVDNTEIDRLTEELELAKEQNDKYNNLLNNLNDLLSNVYYGYAENDEWVLDGFTAFSLNYNDEIYLITAGHCVEDKEGKYYNHRFKANFSDEWIYPELLIYESDYDENIDYAIFYSETMGSGLKYNSNNENCSKFVLGNGDKNTFKSLNLLRGIPGESGSPIVNLSGEAVEIFTGSSTDIDIVIKAIDDLE